MLKGILSIGLLVFYFGIEILAQEKEETEAVSPIKKENQEYKGMAFNVGNGRTLKLSFTNQMWVRYTQTNPGTTVFDDPVDDIFDIGLRRSRIVLTGEPRENVNVFMQIGMNNFNYISKKHANFYFIDALADYQFVKDKFFLGTGLTAWGGFSRFSFPSIGSIMGIDAPLFAQATNDATDQFLRKLSVFAKGDLGRFDYRVAVSKPMAIQQSESLNLPVDTFSTFSQKASKPQIHGYFEYAFLDKESHKNAYTVGAYLGKKKVLNIGAGFLYQPKGMQIHNASGDTSYTNIMVFSADVFYDAPTKNNGAISFYGAYYNYDFGKHYLRNVGAMNPANGSIDPTIVNGGGYGFPQIGTGSIFYAQGGYMLADKDEDDKLRFMPYTALMLADFDALEDNMFYFDIGLNMYLHGHRTKFTVAMQNRPVFKTNSVGNNEFYTRKLAFIGSLQVAI